MKTISVNHVSKAYKQYHSRWGRLLEWMMPSTHKRHDLKWILRDIHFDVNPGEAVALVGINGAGKSTLLKMITGTTQPTAGNIDINGRVAALLELGMGFHPDFTGRQNVFMAGQLMGLQANEIAAMMPEIEAFAEIGDYIDEPVRVYSSGMQMRLAFSVATAIRPDVLIVDEALSVGDAYFQHKSFERIKDFKKLGTTLLIVSHDKQAIQSICDRAILLNAGRLEIEGEPETVMDYYNALLAEKQNQKIKQIETSDGKTQTVSGSGEVVISDVTLFNTSGQQIETVAVGQSISLRIKATCQTKVNELVVGYMIKDRLGQEIFGTNTYHHKNKIKNLSENESIEFYFDFQANLGPGSYSIAVALHADDTHISRNYEWRDRALMFNIINIDKEAFVGVAWIPPVVRCSQ
jgi:lipopolysaccharide transport system ATP-binding protein